MSIRSAAPLAPVARLSPKAWGLLLALCGAIFLEGVDVAMLNVAVPSIRADLGLTNATAQWAITAYLLGYAGFMLLGGRSADLFGRKRVFVTALIVFIIFSGLAGLADAGWILVLSRFVTGVAAAFMTPAGLSIITTSFEEGPARNRALVIYGAAGAGGFTLGLVAGGLLTAAHWRWVFFAPVLLGLLILLASTLLIRSDGARIRQTAPFDVPGAVTVTAAMGAAVYGLVHIGEPGTTRLYGAVALALALALGGAFVAIERRSAAPLVRLSLLQRASLVRTNAAALLYAGSFFGFQFVITLYLQDLRGWSPIQTGLTFLVMGLDLVLAPLLTARLVQRFGTTRVILAGFGFAAAAYVLFLRMHADWTYLQMLPMLIMVGIAFALAYGPLTLAATDGVASSDQGLAGGLLNTSFQFGAAFGLAIVTSILVGTGEDVISLDGYRMALVGPVIMIVLGGGIVAIGMRGRVVGNRPGDHQPVAE